jgi:hypothetical protein
VVVDADAGIGTSDTANAKTAMTPPATRRTSPGYALDAAARFAQAARI